MDTVLRSRQVGAIPAKSRWVYFPLYPSIVRFFGLAGVDLWWAGVRVTIMSGVTSVDSSRVTINHLKKALAS